MWQNGDGYEWGTCVVCIPRRKWLVWLWKYVLHWFAYLGTINFKKGLFLAAKMPNGRNNCILDWSYFAGSLGLHHTPHRVRPASIRHANYVHRILLLSIWGTPHFNQSGVYPILRKRKHDKYFSWPHVNRRHVFGDWTAKEKAYPIFKFFCPYLTAYWLKYGVELQSQSKGNPTTFLHQIRT